jgi:hypothetical protein
MSNTALSAEDTGLEVIDLQHDLAFARRTSRERNMSAQIAGMDRLASAFVAAPESILQELVDSAIELCAADSAGISIEQKGATDEHYYKWVATAGEYGRFLNAMLPRLPSACGLCLERGQPQLFRVSQRFFDLMGIEAPTVTDGILLPWQADETRGTVWIMAHGRAEAFDWNDCRIMQVLANFAAMGVRQQRQQVALIEQASAAAAAAMANDLAHQINNPLQSLTNLAYLAGKERSEIDGKSLAHELSEQVERLSGLVGRLLALRGPAIARK